MTTECREHHENAVYCRRCLQEMKDQLSRVRNQLLEARGKLESLTGEPGGLHCFENKGQKAW